MPVSTTEDETTVLSPSSRGGDASGETNKPRDWNAPAYQPPGYTAPNGAQKRKVWPWVMGILGVFLIALIGLGVAASIFLPRFLDKYSQRSSSNQNDSTSSSNANAPIVSNDNSETPGSDSNVDESNSNSNNADTDVNAPPPTDTTEVLSTLTDIEHEWTVANINANKKALDRILADDYVAVNLDGSTVGKVEYISTIQRDTETRKWEFEDLKVDLKGNRATLTGVIKYYLRSGDRSFQFSDTFVWRDGRWQATASELKEIPRVTL